MNQSDKLEEEVRRILLARGVISASPVSSIPPGTRLFNIINNPVHFNTNTVVIAQQIIPVDHWLYVHLLTTKIQGDVEVTANVIVADETLVTYRSTIHVSGTDTEGEVKLLVDKGLLIGMTVRIIGGVIPYGHILCTATLSRGTLESRTDVAVLFSDYISEKRSIGFPGSTIRTDLPTLGVIEHKGLSFSTSSPTTLFTVGTNLVKKLKSLRINITTVAGGSDRILLVRYQTPTFKILVVTYSFLIPPSSSVQFNLAEGLAIEQIVTTAYSGALPSDIWLKEGSFVDMALSNFVNGDLFTDFSHTTESFLERD